LCLKYCGDLGRRYGEVCLDWGVFVGWGLLVITGDIPLAYQVLDKGGHALNPRGELYTEDNIKERLNRLDFMDTLRSSGIDTGGPSALNVRDRQAFANQLDKFLMQHGRAV